MNQTVLNWLDHTAASLPDKTAFTDGTNSITFAQFDRYTRSIGTYVAGVAQPHSPVVVMCGRHIITPAVFLGVVRAGCFYAPMDATYPFSESKVRTIIQYSNEEKMSCFFPLIMYHGITSKGSSKLLDNIRIPTLNGWEFSILVCKLASVQF